MWGMPATFPSHLAAVLPLKLWRPAWFDGVALAVGSMAPDLAYALDGFWFERPMPALPALWEVAHSPIWFSAWGLPVTLLLCHLVRRAVPAVVSHLPAPVSAPLRGLARPASVRGLACSVSVRGFTRSVSVRGFACFAFRAWLRTPASARGFARLASVRGFACSAALRGLARLFAPLRCYARLGLGRPRWYVTVLSACIGGASHVVWDRLALGPLDLTSSVLGGAFGLWLLLRLATSRPAPFADDALPADGALPAGHSLSPARRPVLFWGTAAVVLASGAALLPFLPGYFLPHTTSARAILLVVAALLIAAAAVRSRPVRREPLQQ